MQLENIGFLTISPPILDFLRPNLDCQLLTKCAFKVTRLWEV